MIEACKKHKIDMILTKSSSRFSHNTLNSIRCIRLQKSLGIVIEFEKECPNTGDLGSEIYLALILGLCLRQEQVAEPKCHNGQAPPVQGRQVPVPIHKYFIGYRCGEDGWPEIHPEGAKTIEHIFCGFLAGKTPAQLKTELEEEHILSSTGMPTWSKATIQNILSNEKYAGDVLLQKNHREFPDQEGQKNRGEVTQYYVTDIHPAIIPREISQQVQLELARRSSRPKVSQRKTKTERGKYTSKFALSERLVCGECGCMYRRTRWVKRNSTKEYVWRCINQLENGKKYCKNSPTLKEAQLHEAVMAAIREQFTDREKVKEALKDVEEKIILHSDGKQDVAPLLNRIQEIDQAMSNLLLLVSHSEDSSYDAKFKALAKEKADLQAQVDAVEQAARQDQDRKQKLQAVLEAIDRQPVNLERYDDELVRRIVEKSP